MTDFTNAPCAGQVDIMYAPDFYPALELCAACPRYLRQACYDQAKSHEGRADDPTGVAGGIPAHQRRYLTIGFRVPLISGRFLPSTNPDVAAKVIRSLNNPQPIRADDLGFRIPANRPSLPPGELVPCPSWGAIARHRTNGETCDVCRQWRAEQRIAS